MAACDQLAKLTIALNLGLGNLRECGLNGDRPLAWTWATRNHDYGRTLRYKSRECPLNLCPAARELPETAMAFVHSRESQQRLIAL